MDGNIKKHGKTSEVQDSMIKVKDRTLEASFDGIKTPDIGGPLEFEKGEDINGVSAGRRTHNLTADGEKPFRKNTNASKDHSRTCDTEFDGRKRSIQKKDNNFLLGESISFEKSYDKPPSTIPMPSGQVLNDKPRKGFGIRDQRSINTTHNTTNTVTFPP